MRMFYLRASITTLGIIIINGNIFKNGIKYFVKGKKQWLNKGVSKAKPNQAKKTALKRIAKAPEKVQPVAPYQFDKNNYLIDLYLGIGKRF